MDQETLREAARALGRMGGHATRERYGPEFYAEIGQKGGSKVAEQRGREFYSRIGRMGGEAVRDKMGPGFYSRIGQKGGAKMAERGRDYYSEIGRRGGRPGKKKSQSARATDEAMVELRAELRALRLTAGLNLGQMGQRMGVSRAYVSNMELGHAPLTLDLERRYREALVG